MRTCFVIICVIIFNLQFTSCSQSASKTIKDGFTTTNNDTSTLKGVVIWEYKWGGYPKLIPGKYNGYLEALQSDTVSYFVECKKRILDKELFAYFKNANNVDSALTRFKWSYFEMKLPTQTLCKIHKSEKTGGWGLNIWVDTPKRPLIDCYSSPIYIVSLSEIKLINVQE